MGKFDIKPKDGATIFAYLRKGGKLCFSNSRQPKRPEIKHLDRALGCTLSIRTKGSK
jgi:hypothetical protein